MGAPKRPLTGYFRFINTIRAEVEQETGLNGIKVTPHLSARWNALDDSAKEKFNSAFKKDMVKWKKKNDAYKKTKNYKNFQAQKKAQKLGKKPKDKNQPKRPMSAYIFFSNEMRPKIQKSLGTKEFAPVAKEISEAWAKLDEGSKAKYQAKNEKAKAKYAKDLAKYQQSKKYEQYQQIVTDWKLKVKAHKKAMQTVAPAKKIIRRKK